MTTIFNVGYNSDPECGFFFIYLIFSFLTFTLSKFNTALNACF